MYKALIDALHKTIILNRGINVLEFEDPVIFRNIFLDLENNLIFSEDNESIDFKKILVIGDCLNLNINDKKIVTGLHKYLEKSATMENIDDFKRIQNDIFLLFEDLIDTAPFDVEYDLDISLSKLFGLFHLGFFEGDKKDYLSYLLNHVKALHELTNVTILVTYNLSNLLTAEEKAQLKNELAIYKIEILDCVLSIKNDEDPKLIVDSDYCII